MKTKFKYIHFVESGDGAWVCRSNKTLDYLGECEWYPPWRCWVYAAIETTVHSPDCMFDIATFAKALPKPKKGERDENNKRN